MIMIAPSILAADFARLGEQVKAAEAGGASRIHVDVMDGHFVPNLSMGDCVVRSLRPITKLPLEVHLMTIYPEVFIDGFAKAGADSFIFHLEVHKNPKPLIDRIRAMGKGVGLAFNPDYDISYVKPWLTQIDLALCMTVFPGFGGQRYIEACNPRLKQLRAWIQELNPKCELEVDGGIDKSTIIGAHASGADVFVAGTAVFGQPDIAEAVRQLKSLV